MLRVLGRAGAPCGAALARRCGAPSARAMHDDFKRQTREYSEDGDVHAQIEKDIASHKAHAAPDPSSCGQAARSSSHLSLARTARRR